MKITVWCKIYLIGTIVKADDGFAYIKCDDCNGIHKVFIKGNAYKSRNYVTPKKETE